MQKKSRGFGLVGTAVSAVVLLSAFGLSFYLGSNVVRDYKTQAVMRECDVIDRALSRYSISHVGIQEDTVLYDGTSYVRYTGNRSYPKSLSDLGIIRDEQAMFSDIIDLEKFDYDVSVDSKTGLATYTLGVKMPNGHYYTSPGSGK